MKNNIKFGKKKIIRKIKHMKQKKKCIINFNVILFLHFSCDVTQTKRHKITF